MKDRLHLLFGSRLGGSDVHAAIDLHRVSGNNLCPRLTGKENADSGLAGSGRTDQRNSVFKASRLLFQHGLV